MKQTVPSLPIPLLRDAVARQAARVSLRRAAREVGVSPNGLRNFLNGAAPRGTTRAKLERWLAARSGLLRPPTVGRLVRLLNELAGDLAPEQAAALGRDIARLLAVAYEQRRVSPPRWVQELAKQSRRRAASGPDVA